MWLVLDRRSQGYCFHNPFFSLLALEPNLSPPPLFPHPPRPPPAPIPGSTGPYMMVVPPEGIASLTADAGNSTCFDPPCTFSWMLLCPNKTVVALAGSNPMLTAGPSPFETIDTTGARNNFT